MKKKTLAQVLSCEFRQISNNTFFTEHLWTTASINDFILDYCFDKRKPLQSVCSKISYNFNVNRKW